MYTYPHLYMYNMHITNVIVSYIKQDRSGWQIIILINDPD